MLKCKAKRDIKRQQTNAELKQGPHTSELDIGMDVGAVKPDKFKTMVNLVRG